MSGSSKNGPEFFEARALACNLAAESVRPPTKTYIDPYRAGLAEDAAEWLRSKLKREANKLYAEAGKRRFEKEIKRGGE